MRKSQNVATGEKGFCESFGSAGSIRDGGLVEEVAGISLSVERMAAVEQMAAVERMAAFGEKVLAAHEGKIASILEKNFQRDLV